jgi:hypothetical protein
MVEFRYRHDPLMGACFPTKASPDCNSRAII